MSIRDGEVVEVVLGPNDVVQGVYALDEEGVRVVQLPVTNVSTDYRPQDPGRTTLELFSFRTVTTREVT